MQRPPETTALIGGWLVCVGLAVLGEVGVVEPVSHGTDIYRGRFDLDAMATVAISTTRPFADFR